MDKQKVESKFFDLDDIIAKSESTSCTFTVEALNPEFFREMLGIGKPTQNSDGYVAETPFWLLEAVDQTQFSIHLPHAYSMSMQSVLNADSRNVNLSRLQQQFYANGMQLCRLMRGENAEGALNLSKCLLSTLTQRLGDIISNSVHQRFKCDRFDILEMKLFLEGKECKDDVDRWLRQENKYSNRKRKRNS